MSGLRTAQWLYLTSFLAVTISAHADSYDFEAGISYDANRSSIDTTTTLPSLGPIAPGEPLTLRLNADNDDDDVTVFGTWYFDGVTAPSGPRSRAAFLGRASAVSLRYTRITGDSTFTQTSSDPVVFPPTEGRSDLSADNISANLRYVWPGSGWYGFASVSTADTEIDSEFGSTDFSADAYGLGVGKYIGSQTTIDLNVLRVDSDASGFVIGGNSTSTEVAVGFSHIGSLGQRWQYGTDVVLATTEVGSSDGSFDLRLSLYPSRPLAFGIEVTGALEDFGDNRKTYELFASWFPRERIELRANAGTEDVDLSDNVDLDDYNFGIGVNFRF